MQMQNKPENTSAQETPPQGQMGTTLRDYFAGQALISAVMKTIDDDDNHVIADETLPDKIAEACYQFADAMLIARAK